MGIVLFVARIFMLPLPWLVVILLGVLFGYGLVMIFLRLKASRAGAKLEDSIQKDTDARPGREKEREELKTRFQAALQALKKSQVGKGRRGAGALLYLRLLPAARATGYARVVVVWLSQLPGSQAVTTTSGLATLASSEDAERGCPVAGNG